MDLKSSNSNRVVLTILRCCRCTTPIVYGGSVIVLEKQFGTFRCIPAKTCQPYNFVAEHRRIGMASFNKSYEESGNGSTITFPLDPWSKRFLLNRWRYVIHVGQHSQQIVLCTCTMVSLVRSSVDILAVSWPWIPAPAFWLSAFRF